MNLKQLLNQKKKEEEAERRLHFFQVRETTTTTRTTTTTAAKRTNNKNIFKATPIVATTTTTGRSELTTAPSDQLYNQLSTIIYFNAWVLLILGAVAVFAIIYWCFTCSSEANEANEGGIAPDLMSPPSSSPSSLPPSSPLTPSSTPSSMPHPTVAKIRRPSLAQTSTRCDLCDLSCCNNSECDLSCCNKNPCDHSCCNNTRSTDTGSRLTSSASMSSISSVRYSTSNQPYRNNLKTIMSNDNINDLILNNFPSDWRHEDLTQAQTQNHHHHQSPTPPPRISLSTQHLGENNVRSRGVKGRGRGVAQNNPPLIKTRSRIAK